MVDCYIYVQPDVRRTMRNACAFHGKVPILLQNDNKLITLLLLLWPSNVSLLISYSH